MGKMRQKLVRWARLFRARFDSPLPQGATELTAYIQSLLSLYELPDFASYRQSVATMIMHLGPTQDRAPKLFFAKSIRKAMANQVAYDLISKLRADEKAKAEAVKLDAPPEDGTNDKSVQV